MSIVKKRSDEVLNGIRKVIDGKTIIILQSDRADSVELYRDYVFPNNDVKIHSIDECDFKGGLHSLKYHFIKQKFHVGAKIHDFGYWGTSKKKKVGGDLSGEAGIIFRHSGGTGGSNFDGNLKKAKDLI